MFHFFLLNKEPESKLSCCHVSMASTFHEQKKSFVVIVCSNFKATWFLYQDINKLLQFLYFAFFYWFKEQMYTDQISVKNMSIDLAHIECT